MYACIVMDGYEQATSLFILQLPPTAVMHALELEDLAVYTKF
jgi:hypothetical protein